MQWQAQAGAPLLVAVTLPSLPGRNQICCCCGRGRAIASSSSASSATIHNSLCDIFLFVSYSQAAAARPKSNNKSIKVPGVETVDSLVAVTCLRAAGEEEGAKYIYTALHSITQHPRHRCNITSHYQRAAVAKYNL